MGRNRLAMDVLFEEGGIDLKRGVILDSAPLPIPIEFDFSRVEAMMLGLAVGDSLGKPVERMLPGKVAAKYGEVRDYLPNRRSKGKPVGVPSDDTQLAFWTLEQLIEDAGFVPENLPRRFAKGRIIGIGKSAKQFLTNYSKNPSWYQNGVKSAGNGALMRIAPMLIPYARCSHSGLWVDTVLSAIITHNDSASTAACVSFVNILWKLLQMKSPPEPMWWIDTFVETARQLEMNESYRPRGGKFMDFQGPLWRFVDEKVRQAYKAGLSTEEACSSWYSGAYVLETVPSVLYILMRHGDNFEEALVRAINDTKDSDTVGAIVGAAMGALHGREAIPDRWLSNLLGRTSEKDDGRVFELLGKARRVFWSDHP